MCIYTIKNKRLLTRNNSKSIRMVTLGTPAALSSLCSNQNVKVQLQKACYVSFMRGFIRALSSRYSIVDTLEMVYVIIRFSRLLFTPT